MKKYFKVLLNGYDEFYSLEEFKDKISLLKYLEDNQIKNVNNPVRQEDIKEIEHTEIKTTDAYTENNAMLYIDCSNCNKSFIFKNNYDEDYNYIVSEYEENERAMFKCSECGQLHIITEIEEDPFRR